MKKSKIWTSIVEAIVVTLIITVWIIWVFNIYTNAQKLSITSKNRLTASLIARDWIEALTNIRDTNWKIFSANNTNCWNVKDYNANCITDPNLIIQPWSYKIYKSNNNRWYLYSVSASETRDFDVNYRNDYKVMLDSNWLYTQSWWTQELIPTFTRELKISYDSTTPANQKMKINSIVKWVDNSLKTPHKVEFETVLSNWKKN